MRVGLHGDMTELGITLEGQTFEHLVYHFVLTYSNWEAGTICYSESRERWIVSAKDTFRWSRRARSRNQTRTACGAPSASTDASGRDARGPDPPPPSGSRYLASHELQASLPFSAQCTPGLTLLRFGCLV